MEIVPAGTVTKIMFMKIDYDVFTPIGLNFDYDFFTATRHDFDYIFFTATKLDFEWYCIFNSSAYVTITPPLTFQLAAKIEERP